MAPESRMLFSRADAGTRPGLQRPEPAPGALPDFPVAAMWRAVTAGTVFRHPSVESPLRGPSRNPAPPGPCGFNPLPVHRRGGDIADTVPNGWNVPRFLKALAGVGEERGLASAMVDGPRTALMAALPDFGRHPGHGGKATGSHPAGTGDRKTGTTSGPDADRGRRGTSGVGRDGRLRAKVTSRSGHRLHVTADTRHGIPVAVSTARAPAPEVREPERMAPGLMERDPALAERRSEFTAGRGPDSGPPRPRSGTGGGSGP